MYIHIRVVLGEWGGEVLYICRYRTQYWGLPKPSAGARMRRLVVTQNFSEYCFLLYRHFYFFSSPFLFSSSSHFLLIFLLLLMLLLLQFLSENCHSLSLSPSPSLSTSISECSQCVRSTDHTLIQAKIN